jgi:hypothetical protein
MRLLTQDEIDGFRRMPGSFDAMVQAIHDHGWAEGRASEPAWHDKPTAPGLWVVGSRCLHINELDLPIYERSNCRWFGPVPADDGGKP